MLADAVAEDVGFLEIHVSAQADRAAAFGLRTPDHRDDAGLAYAAVMLDAERVELARDDLGGAMLLEAELRMRVQIAPHCGQRSVFLADELDGIHALAPAARAAALWRLIAPPRGVRCAI